MQSLVLLANTGLMMGHSICVSVVSRRSRGVHMYGRAPQDAPETRAAQLFDQAREMACMETAPMRLALIAMTPGGGGRGNV